MEKLFSTFLLQIYREEIILVFVKYLKYEIATNLSLSFVAGSTWSYLAVTTAGVVFPLVVNLQPFYITLILFIPIMGRSGTDVIPDVPIALFVILMMLISCQYCVSSLPVIICSIRHRGSPLLYYQGFFSVPYTVNVVIFAGGKFRENVAKHFTWG